MKIVNSNRYFLPSIHLDKLIKIRSHKGYRADCRIDLSHPEKIEDGGYRYVLNYNCLHKEIYKRLISDIKKNHTIDQKKVNRVSDIFWSLFSNSSISAPNLKTVEVLSGSELRGYTIISQTVANSTGNANLNFDFWCTSPAQFAFLNIVIVTTREIDSIKFDTEIIHCGSDIYNMIANKETYTSTGEKDMVVFCSGGNITKIQLSHAQKYYHEIVCSFTVPYITDPKMCTVRVWGEDRLFDDDNFVLQKEGTGNLSDGGSSVSETYENWREYICLDKSRVNELKTKKIWMLVTPMEYKPPKDMIAKYSQICDTIAEQKLMWILHKTGSSFPMGVSKNKTIVPMDEIKKSEINYGAYLSHDIMSCHSIEERFETVALSDTDESKDESKIEDTRRPVKVEVDVSITGIYHTTVFFNDKTVEEHYLNRLDILNRYRDVMDEKTHSFFIE